VSCALAVAAPCVKAGLVMAVTRRFRVFPLYHQVEIRDATDGVDRPLWETGKERVLAAAQCIVLATRSDLYGEVEIEVRVGAGLEDQAGGQPLFDGELLTTGQGILVGNSLGEYYRRVGIVKNYPPDARHPSLGNSTPN
jgi:hypothetical protein